MDVTLLKNISKKKNFFFFTDKQSEVHFKLEIQLVKGKGLISRLSTHSLQCKEIPFLLKIENIIIPKKEHIPSLHITFGQNKTKL